MRKSLVVAVVGLFVAGATAEPLKIIGFDTATGITFEGATVSNYYTIEFAMSPGGPWTNWGSITDQPVTGTVMAVPSPFFYRIRQTDSSAFPPYAVVGHTHSNITASMLEPDQVVKSINSFRDNVTISGGANVTVTPSGNGIGISAASIPNMQVFDTNGTFTVPAGITRLMVEVWGGGGGGGAADNDTQGGGGGGGGYGKQVFEVSPGATYDVTVGNGGSGSTSNNGTAGELSSFGTLISATGGSPGVDGSASENSGGGGAGGTSTALFNLSGQPGNQFSSIPTAGKSYSQSAGGAAPQGGLGGVGGMVAFPGYPPGGGGGGGGTMPIPWPGGDGGKGIVIVYY